MSSNRERGRGVFPGSRTKHIPTARKGSWPWMVALLVDARKFALRFNIDANNAWAKAGGVVEAETDFVTKELKRVLTALLQVPELNTKQALEAETDQAIHQALEAIALTEA